MAARALEALLRALPQCQGDAAWLAWVGRQLNAVGRYAEAADMLERALLLDPTRADVLTEYAIALAGGGDLPAALALLQSLLQDQAIPPAVRARLQAQAERWQATARMPAGGAGGGIGVAGAGGPARAGRVHASLRLGRDSNLLGAPNLDKLTLTLPEQSLELPLDATYRSRPGTYAVAEAGWNGLLETAEGGRWQALLNLRARHSSVVPEAELQQGAMVLDHSRPFDSHGPGSVARAYFTVAYTALRSRTGTRYATRGGGAGLQWVLSEPWAPGAAAPPGGGCQARLGAEVEQRDLTSNPVLSGHYRGGSALLACDGSAALAGLGWQLAARAGRDNPTQASRPGGPQAVWALRAVAEGPLPATWGLWRPAEGLRWQADWEAERRDDTTPYSPLLGNAVRQTLRQSSRLAVQAAWAGATLQLGLDASHQSSNLPLFKQRNWGPFLLLRRTW